MTTATDTYDWIETSILGHTTINYFSHSEIEDRIAELNEGRQILYSLQVSLEKLQDSIGYKTNLLAEISLEIPDKKLAKMTDKLIKEIYNETKCYEKNKKKAARLQAFLEHQQDNINNLLVPHYSN